MAQKPETLLKRILEKLNAKAGNHNDLAVILGAGSARSEVREVIPTGIEVVDRHVIGCGGLAVGKLHEVFGGEGAGKSAFTYQCLGAVQRLGGLAVIVESEEALSAERATVYGIDVDQLLVLQPDHMEMGILQMETTLKTIPSGSGPVLMAWDSIAATPTMKEVEEGSEAGAEMGERARLLSRACRILPALAQAKRCALLFVNQTRSKIGVMYGNPETTPGGAAVKFHASFRMSISEGKAIKDGEKHSGKYVHVQARKNRFAEPHRKAPLRLDFASGWNDAWSTLDFAKERDLIEKSAHGEKALNLAREKLGWAAVAAPP